jgi:hypothetical protein
MVRFRLNNAGLGDAVGMDAVFDPGDRIARVVMSPQSRNCLVKMKQFAYILISIIWPNKPGPSLSVERARSDHSPTIDKPREPLSVARQRVKRTSYGYRYR